MILDVHKYSSRGGKMWVLYIFNIQVIDFYTLFLYRFYNGNITFTLNRTNM